MTYGEYLNGIAFIKKNSGTLEEQEYRLKQWRALAYPLVNAKTFVEPYA